MNHLAAPIESVAQLDDVLTTPSEQLIESITSISSPLVIVGAGGKMGPSLAMLAQRAAKMAGHKLEIVAASRFQNAGSSSIFQQNGIGVLSVDVFNAEHLKLLPDSANIVYLVGMKFGTSNDPVPTWATNTVAPVLISERYPGARIVALSSGNVYPMSLIDSGGSTEEDPLSPIGEYPNAAVARERIFQHYATKQEDKLVNATVLMRLNYAHDLRYGVISEIAGKVWRGEPIDLTMGYFNAIWQGDANERILRSFSLCSSPARMLNLTGTETNSVQEVAVQLGQLMQREPVFTGSETSTALLSNASRMAEEFGQLRVGTEQLIHWIAHWTRTGGTTLGRPTHFQTRDGKF